VGTPLIKDVSADGLCALAYAMGALVLSVRGLGALGCTQTPNWCVFTLSDYEYLSPDEKRVLHGHIRNGGSLIFLDREAGQDALAHEIGHVAMFLAGQDLDFSKPNRELAALAKRCKFDDYYLESNDELRAECVARRLLGLPLFPQLHAFSEKAFSATTVPQ
jgi:hypothetical protein